jgi:hypothetical protein
MRKFNESSPITYCFGFKTSPMIKIDSKRGMTVYQSENEKIQAFKTRKKSDKFIIAWSGQWKTDVFEVSEEDINLILNQK